MTISKNKIRLLKSLSNKKERNAEGVFIAEGPKAVGDLLPYFSPLTIVASRQWIAQNKSRIYNNVELIEAENDELSKISCLQHPQDVFAIFNQRHQTYAPNLPSKQLVLALDGIQDPGNLGTIIRIADWFGIAHIVCGQGTADIYNPKTVQATMGSLGRVTIEYVDLPQYIRQLPVSTPIYGTLLDGDSIYETSLSDVGLIVMGNEGTGISDEVRGLITKAIRIPSFANGTAGYAESLNVAVATAVTCSEFRRRS